MPLEAETATLILFREDWDFRLRHRANSSRRSVVYSPRMDRELSP
jgi:hypothetical protein